VAREPEPRSASPGDGRQGLTSGRRRGISLQHGRDLRAPPPKPLPAYVEWVASVAREDQFTSAVVVGELFEGAFASAATKHHLKNIRRRVLPAVTALPYDVAVAPLFAEIAARLRAEGRPLPDADLQIAATAVYHGLELVTGNIRNFERVPGLEISRVLADARSGA